MARTFIEIDHTVWLLQRAFGPGTEHGFIQNAFAVPDTLWNEPPVSGRRSAADIAAHVGAGIWVYWSCAFDEPMQWDASFDRGRRFETKAALLDWARDGLDRLIASVTALDDDADLEEPRPVHYSAEPVPTRQILASIMEHCLYHAGEINHVRALLMEADSWPGD